MRGPCSPGDAACLCSSTIQSQTVPRVPRGKPHLQFDFALLSQCPAGSGTAGKG